MLTKYLPNHIYVFLPICTLTGQRSQVSLGHQADLIEQMLGGVHLSLSNSQGGNNAGGDSNLPVGGVLDEGGQSPGWVGEEVEEEADV